jgi:quinol monooxygenase YgiN
MVTEFAEIEVKPGMEQQFRDGVDSCKPVFARAPGCHGLELHRAIEHPHLFILLVRWDSVQHHMDMRASPDFQIWRGAVGDCFAGTPRVFHTETVVS